MASCAPNSTAVIVSLASELFDNSAIEAASPQKFGNTCAACRCAQDCKDVRRPMPIVFCEHINRPQESSHHVKRDRRAVSTTARKCEPIDRNHRAAFRLLGLQLVAPVAFRAGATTPFFRLIHGSISQ